MPVSQQQALRKAQEYLSVIAFSRQGLIDQLTGFEGFPVADATWGVDHAGADWKQQAARKAQEYLDVIAFSRQGLIDQLVNFEHFTASEAEYGVSAVGL